MTSEAVARIKVDALLAAQGWSTQHPPYFPIQNLPKISPSKSSLVNTPVISPSA